MQGVTGSASKAIPCESLDPLKSISGYATVAWDIANESADPHAVGIAIKREVSEKATIGKKSRASKSK